MTYRIRFRVLSLLVTALLAPLGVLAQSPESTPPAAPGGTWHVADVHELDLETRYAALSPDGQRLAAIGPDDSLCILDIEAETADCAGERLPIRAETITWAPDGTAVAFALDAIRLLYESDIYVYELATGELVNLTDDGVEGDLLDTLDSDPPMDDVPMWSPDSQQIAFSRSFRGDEGPGSTAIMRIDRGGGEPAEIARLNVAQPFLIWMPMHWLPDGTLVYSQISTDLGDPSNGVWTLDVDGGGSPTLLVPGSKDSDVPGPMVSDVADGTAIVYSYYLMGQFTVDRAQPLFWLVDLATGDREPMPLPPEENGDAPWVIEAAFSPDGGTTLLVTVSTAGSQLMTLDMATGGITPIEPEPRDVSYLPGAPQWTPGNTVLLQRSEGPLLFTLERAGGAPDASPVASPVASPAASEVGWQVTEERDVDLGNRYAVLSPDGLWLAGKGPDDTICIWDVATLVPSCASEAIPIREESIAWAPDSSAVAFAPDAILRGYESDIYLFERESVDLTNLTDDGVDGNILDAIEAGAPIDDVPTWSPDGQRIAFVRSVSEGESRSTTIMWVDRAGGEPVEMLPLDVGEPMAVTTPMHWLPDGTLLYSQIANDLSDPQNGVWKVGVDDGSSPLQVVPGFEGGDVPGPKISDAVPGKAIVSSSYLFGRFGADTDQPLFWMVDIATGERAPLPRPAGAPEATPVVIEAAFTPGGSDVLLVTMASDGPRLMMLSGDTGEITSLDSEPRDTVFAPNAPQLASNGTVLLQRPIGPPLLVTLERADDAQE